MARGGRPFTFVRRAAGCAAAVAAFLGGSAAGATVDIRWSGAWPDESQELITLSADQLPRAEAIRQLADKAGWSVIVEGAPGGLVDLHVTKQPAARVLQLILGSGFFTAQRQGNLVSISPGAGALVAGSVPPPPGKDRVVAASSVVIGPDEVVGDLSVFGGSADVRGQITGDVSVFGGSVRVREGGHVFGDVATFGGSVKLDPGARVDGDLDTIGGSIHRGDGAIVGGHGHGQDGGGPGDGARAGRDTGAKPPKGRRPPRPDIFHSAGSAIGGAITRAALLFALGIVLWALAGRRVERLQAEVIARPMRAFAMGVVSAVAGAVLLVVLCVTVVGIPVALAIGLAGVVGTYAGVCAALTTVGAGLLRHRTASPYVHLALGCAVYLVLGAIPFVGRFVTAAVVLIGLGALVGTRAAGLINLGRRGAPTSAE